MADARKLMETGAAEMAQMEHLALLRGIAASPATKGAQFKAKQIIRLAQREYESSIPSRTDYGHLGLTITAPGADGEANIDFTPPTKFNPNGVRTAYVKAASDIILAGIESLRIYLLLTDSGFLVAPTVVDGYTNVRMAKIAERAGFNRMPVTNGGVSVKVQATLSDLRQFAFSPEAAQIEAMLTRRIARRSGNTTQEA